MHRFLLQLIGSQAALRLYISSLFFLSVSGAVHAIESSSNTVTPSKVLSIGVSFSIPPWVIKDSDSGIELDILRAALEPYGYEIEPKYMSFGRVYQNFESKKLDGVINVKEGVFEFGFLSDSVVSFQNYAISLRKKNFPETIPMSFLADKKVVGFQEATTLLGSEFRQAVADNPNYSEVAKQHIQVNLLFVREVDFIVMDKSIFGYHWHNAMRSNAGLKNQYSQEVRFHSLFEKSDYAYIFRDEKVRDEFNQGLAKLKSNGRYDAIFKQYSDLADLYIAK
jgi:polar amino acid transport system substrate-binding protein